MSALESPPPATACQAWDVDPAARIVVGYCVLGNPLPVRWIDGNPEVLDGVLQSTGADGSIQEQPVFQGLAVGVNASGSIVAQVNARAAIWDDGLGVWQAIPTSGLFSTARGINDYGAVAGTVITLPGFVNDAAVWDQGQEILLDRTEGALGCRAYAINDPGMVAGGCATLVSEQDVKEIAVLWNRDGTIREILGEGSPGAGFPGANTFGRGLNAVGTVVGTIDGDAYRWPAPALGAEMLASPGVANSVNDRGDTVGYLGINGGQGNNTPRAVMWRANSTVVHDLGTLGGAQSWARAINNKGIVVGFSEDENGVVRAFIMWP